MTKVDEASDLYKMIWIEEKHTPIGNEAHLESKMIPILKSYTSFFFFFKWYITETCMVI